VQFFKRTLQLLVMLCIAAPACEIANAYPTQDDNTPGTLAIGYRKQSNWWLRQDAAVVDAKITTSPPDSAKLDRRLEGMTILGFDSHIAGRFGFRFNVEAEHSTRRQAEQVPPEAQIDATRNEYRPSVDFTFETDQGLEIFIGHEQIGRPTFKETIVSETQNSTTTYEEVAVATDRAGICRRAGAWSGGIYTVQGGDTLRDYTKSASDGSSVSGDEVIFIPSETGIFGEFTAGPAVWDFDFSFVQARGEGPEDNNGNTIYTDYLKARIGMYSVLGGIGIHTSIGHQTFSYSDSAYITLDSIPMTNLKSRLIFGSIGNNAFLGMSVAQGKDRQSLPEFNAEYEMTAVALTMGMVFGM
jgi:hypothetical protein